MFRDAMSWRRPGLPPLAAAPRAFAAWEPSVRYPDPSVQILDPSFARYRLALASVERIAHGMRWTEGPVWFGDGRYLLWSDIPNNRIMRWDEQTGAVSVFRQPSNNANGNTRDRQGRLVTCEHDTRRVTRTEHDGTDRHRGRQVRRQAAEFAQRHRGEVRTIRSGSPTRRSASSATTKATPRPPELPTNVYRVDGKSGQITVAAGDINRPNGLAFSPDESKLYIVEANVNPRVIQVYDVVDNGTKLANGRPSSPSSQAKRRTAFASTSTAICGAAGAWARATTAWSSSTRPANVSAGSHCPSAAPTCASAASSATAC